MENQENQETQKNQENQEKYINIYRYKFTDEFMTILYTFSKIHQYDDRHEFKKAWNNWIEEYEDSVNLETRRLIHLGYQEDILDKMFKSARYYFRKKSTEKKAPVKRKKYLNINKELIETIDDHIKNSISDENYKPSEGFLDFCKKNREPLKEEIQNLMINGLNKTEIQSKIKKTYKNRYFIQTIK